jgi:hypothetical protein
VGIWRILEWSCATYHVRLRQVMSLVPHSLRICKLVSTGRFTKDKGIPMDLEVRNNASIFLSKSQSLNYGLEADKALCLTRTIWCRKAAPTSVLHTHFYTKDSYSTNSYYG